MFGVLGEKMQSQDSDLHLNMASMRVVQKTYAIYFDDGHLMAVDFEVKHAQRAHIQDSQSIGLAGRKWERGILVEVLPIGPILDYIDQRAVYVYTSEG